MRTAGTAFWKCTACGGRAATTKALRRVVEPHLVDHVCDVARQNGNLPGVRHRPCPICVRPMTEVRPRPDLPPVDVCNSCRMVWFDPHEYEHIISAAPAPLPAIEADKKLEKPVAPSPSPSEPETEPFAVASEPAPPWEWLGFFAGLPLEIAAPRWRHRPWLTWALAAAVALLRVLFFRDLDHYVKHLGFIPHRPWRHGGLTLFTPFFIHAGWLHLLANLYFLLLFGGHVEDYLGRWRYLLLIALATAGGNLAMAAFLEASTIPGIGASGGIAGLMALYALRFPRARLVLLVMRLYPIPISVWAYFLIWLCIQGLGSIQQMRGYGETAYLAHGGGVAVGVLFWWLDRERHRPAVLTAPTAQAAIAGAPTPGA